MALNGGFGSYAAYNVYPESRSVAADFVFTESDLLGLVQSTGAGSTTATIPLGLPVGWSTTLVQNGSGKVTLVGAVGVTLRNPSAGLRTTARGARVLLQVVGTNEVVVTSAHLEATA